MNSRFGGADSWRAMCRFPVDQVGSDGKTKVRCCDDACDARHNEFTSLGETITCESADFPLRVAVLFARTLGLDGDWSLQGGTEDISAAYRQCPSLTPQFTSIALVDPSTGNVSFFYLPGMNFGRVVY